MKSKMDIISRLYSYSMRKHNGNYSFGFVEGKYRFSYHDHATGRSLRIFIISPDGDEMMIYDKTEWYSSRYYFNGFGKGYTKGPWVNEIEEMFKMFTGELVVKVLEIRKHKKDNKNRIAQIERDKFNKFASLCAA